MGTVSDVKAAEKFSASYQASDDQHPDLASRVAMYRRAVKDGDKRKVAIHARTLMRFARNTGALTSSSSDDDGPTKAELQAQAEALGIPKSGSKSDLEKRIAEKRAADEADGGS